MERVAPAGQGKSKSEGGGSGSPKASPRRNQIVLGSFIGTDDPRWAAHLAQGPHSAYHLPAYLRVIAAYLGGEAVAFWDEVDGASCLIPLIERELPREVAGGEGAKDACSPPPYGGPVFLGDPSRWPALVERFHLACEARGLQTVYLRNSPLLPQPWRQGLERGVVLEHGETIPLDLGQPAEAIWAGFSSRRRRGIRKAEREGYRTVLDDWSTFPAFRAVYRETMDRHEASPFWRFDDPYFDGLVRELEGKIHLCTVLSRDGEVAAAALYLQAGGSLEYHLGGTAESHRGAAPSHLLYDRMWRWAKGAGASVFHLGGGLPSLMEFKGGFSQERAPIHSIRLVPEPARYQRLLELGGIDAPVDGSTGFFPAYRSPE